VWSGVAAGQAWEAPPIEKIATCNLIGSPSRVNAGGSNPPTRTFLLHVEVEMGKPLLGLPIFRVYARPAPRADALDCMYKMRRYKRRKSEQANGSKSARSQKWLH
jgi:hypothetical protein